MNDSRSIAGKFAANIQIERLFIWLMCDALIFLFGVASWIFASESICAGGVFRTVSREITVDDSVTDIWARLGTMCYHVGTSTIPMGGFMQEMLHWISVLGIIQTVAWILLFIPTYFTAKKTLAPYNRIALTASKIAEAKYTPFDDIEHAIERLDPLSDIHISTGNRDLKSVEDSINLLLDRMRESYASQARFVSDASHELRTPIAVIKGYADMLARWGKEDESVLDEGIGAIQKESDNMGRLVEQLLFISRSDNGRQPMNVTEFSLTDMMQEIYNEQVMIDEDHEYISDMKEDITVSGDLSMLKETARILTDNAKKYTPKGGRITLRVMRGEKGEPQFEVADTGIGMDAEDIPHIFDRFYRSDPARNRESGGTGLGLSIAKLIVDRHDGYFKVNSFKDIGSKFTVVLKAPPADNGQITKVS
ncbi:MAG: sensor histidine kinase [Oscillospiraceae bacterium]|nr:sensor histidine kinase [Oscillospiraceae bacterium]